MLARPLLLGLLAVANGCAIVAGFAPPSRTEIGSTVINDGGQPTTGKRFATGVHLASGQTRRNAALDVGVGYVFERIDNNDVGQTAQAVDTGGSVSPPPGGPADHVDAHGAYLDVAHSLHRGPGHRSWLGARGETMVQNGPNGYRAVNGAYARVAWELYATGKGSGSTSDHKGGAAGWAYGAVALGFYLESGYRFVERERPAFVAMGGLSLRLPWLAGIGIGFK